MGLAANGVAGFINAARSWLLVRRGRQLKSPALVADGRHLFTDVISSPGVLGGVGIAPLSGWSVPDPALAAAVALNILWSGWGLMGESVGGLMDEAAAPETMERISEIISTEAKGRLKHMIYVPGMPVVRRLLTSILSSTVTPLFQPHTTSATA